MFFTKKHSMPDIYSPVLHFCSGYKPTSALAAQTCGFTGSFFVEESDSGKKELQRGRECFLEFITLPYFSNIFKESYAWLLRGILKELLAAYKN